MKKGIVALLIVFVASVAFLAPLTVSFSPETQSVQVQVSQAHAETVFGCHIITNFRRCIPEFFYFAFARPVVWFTGLVASWLDYFFFYSINGSTYKSLGFINEGWRIVRDISNIFFIFSLLGIAIAIILKVNLPGSTTPKKLLVNLIIVALLINFSLFFTNVIVDASNILARAFYNNISVTTAGGGEFAEEVWDELVAGEEKPKGISVAVVNNLSIQQLVSSESDIAEGFTDSIGLMVTFVFFVIAVHVILIQVFLVMMWIFLARVVTLALLMVLAPFAFVTLALPGGAGIKQLGFKDWSKQLLNSSFVAPIFAFFMFLVVMFVNSGSERGAFVVLSPGAPPLTLMLQISIPFAVVMGLIFAAKKIAVQMSGELAQKGVALGEKAIKAGSMMAGGAVVGVAAAGAASAGRQTVGRLGAMTARYGRNLETEKKEITATTKIGKRLQEARYAAKSRIVGAALRRGGEAAATSTFDARQTDIGKAAINASGLRQVGFRMKEGGYRGSQEEIEKREKEKAEKLQLQADDPEMRELTKTGAQMKEFELAFQKEIGDFKREIDKARQKLSDNRGGAGEDAARDELQERMNAYEDFKDGNSWTDKSGTTHPPAKNNGLTYKQIDDANVDAQNTVNQENARRRGVVAERARGPNWEKILLKGGAMGALAAATVTTGGVAPILLGASLGSLAVSIKEQLDIRGGDRDRAAEKILADVEVEKPTGTTRTTGGAGGAGGGTGGGPTWGGTMWGLPGSGGAAGGPGGGGGTP